MCDLSVVKESGGAPTVFTTRGNVRNVCLQLPNIMLLLSPYDHNYANETGKKRIYSAPHSISICVENNISLAK
jgi:hypothetical protein